MIMTKLGEEAEILKAFTDPLRLRLVLLLLSTGEVCVCRLAEALAEPEYKISRHLRVLRAAKVVGVRRAGSWMYYRISAERPPLVDCLCRCLESQLVGQAVVKRDRARLNPAACSTGRRQ